MYTYDYSKTKDLTSTLWNKRILNARVTWLNNPHYYWNAKQYSEGMTYSVWSENVQCDMNCHYQESTEQTIINNNTDQIQ